MLLLSISPLFCHSFILVDFFLFQEVFRKRARKERRGYALRKKDRIFSERLYLITKPATN